MHEKDPFGDKLRDKERAEEDLYFKKRDRELLEKLRGQDANAQQPTARELAQGRCPKCGDRLAKQTIDEVPIEQCGSCQGVWLTRDDVAAVSRRGGQSWIAELLERSIVETR